MEVRGRGKKRVKGWVRSANGVRFGYTRRGWRVVQACWWECGGDGGTVTEHDKLMR